MGRKHTVRHKVRRKLDGCANLCDTINQHLAECAQPYEATHKEYFETFLHIGNIIEQARKLIVEFREVL